MKTSSISTSAISEATRLSLMKLQLKLADAQKQLSTGRLADVGAALGSKTGQTVSLRQEYSRLQAITDTNDLVSSRLDATQASLKSMAAGAQSFFNQLMAVRNSGTGGDVLKAQALSSLSSLTNTLNTTSNGVYLFSGINTDVKPVADYTLNPPSANKQAVDNAFLAAFGISQSDPGVANIAAVDMQNFLDNDFAALFSPASWSSTWSSASDQNMRSRISTSELIETSVNANDAAIRKLTSALTMVADLGGDQLGDAAYEKVLDTAIRTAKEAIDGLTGMQARVGATQTRVKSANERMSIQKDIMTSHITKLEGVDPYEAADKVSSLTTQIETAYAMTARLQKLSLLDYL